MRIDASIERVPVLAAIGVTETGCKLVLALQSGDKESASSWRELFRDLKSRGLNSQNVILGIMDGLSGLETVFKEEFSPKAKSPALPGPCSQKCSCQGTKEIKENYS